VAPPPNTFLAAITMFLAEKTDPAPGIRALRALVHIVKFGVTSGLTLAARGVSAGLLGQWPCYRDIFCSCIRARWAATEASASSQSTIR